MRASSRQRPQVAMVGIKNGQAHVGPRRMHKERQVAKVTRRFRGFSPKLAQVMRKGSGRAAWNAIKNLGPSPNGARHIAISSASEVFGRLPQEEAARLSRENCSFQTLLNKMICKIDPLQRRVLKPRKTPGPLLTAERRWPRSLMPRPTEGIVRRRNQDHSFRLLSKLEQLLPRLTAIHVVGTKLKRNKL